MQSPRFPALLVAIFALLAPAASAAPVHQAVVRAGFIYEPGPYPQCHASTIVETAAGELVAAWFGGTAESNPDVCVWVSRWEGGRWMPGVKAADGVQHDAKRYACWNPVLFQPRGGPLQLYYKVGPSPEKWWGILITSTDGGRTWSEPRRLPEDVLGPIKNKPVQLADGTLLAGSSTEDPRLGWQVHLELSPDLGRTWQIVGPIYAYPAVIQTRDGLVHLTYTWNREKIKHVVLDPKKL